VKRHDEIAKRIRTMADERGCTTLDQPGIAELTGIHGADVNMEEEEVEDIIDDADEEQQLEEQEQRRMQDASTWAADEADALDDDEEQDDQADPIVNDRSEDRKEADIFIKGLHMRETFVVDVRVTASNTARARRAYASRCSANTNTPDLTIRPLLLQNEKDKTAHYTKRIELMLAATNDRRRHRFERDKPLSFVDMSFIAAIATPHGNIGPQLQGMLQTLAEQGATADVTQLGFPAADHIINGLKAAHTQHIRAALAAAIVEANFLNLQTFLSSAASHTIRGRRRERGRETRREKQRERERSRPDQARACV